MYLISTLCQSSDVYNSELIPKQFWGSDLIPSNLIESDLDIFNAILYPNSVINSHYI